MKIAGLQKVSLIDFPERIAATVFLAGCNLNCGYCYNHWMLDENAVEEAISREDLLAWLKTRVGLLDGVCLSGGEPTIHPELLNLAQEIKALGLALKLDTNGTRPNVLRALLSKRLLDYVAMDLKAPLDERYHRVAGVRVPLEAIRESLVILREGQCPYELRTTVGPALARQDLIEIAHLILPHETWYLQPFIPTEGVRETGPALSVEDLRALLASLRHFAPRVYLRGAEDYSSSSSPG